MIVGPCTVVTGGREPVVLEGAGVHVVGAHVAHVASVGALAAAYPDEELWPGDGCLLIPGYVNTHAHLARHLARGLRLDDAAAWRRYEEALSPEDVYRSAMAALVEGVQHGVTTVFDFHRSGACIELSLSEIVAAASEVGVRVATCYGVAESDSPKVRRAALEESTGFAEELRHRRQGTLRALLGIKAASVDAVDRLLREALDTSGNPPGVHVDLDAKHSAPRISQDSQTWFNDTVPALWAHAEAAPQAVLGLARARGDALSFVGDGALAESRGIEAGWGSDADVNAPPHLAGRGSRWPGVDRMASDPSPLDPDEGRTSARYEHLMVHGPAWASRFFGEGLGRIEPGAPADLVIVDYRPATEFSTRTLDAHLATGLARAPVSGVMVAGEVVLDQGRFVNLDAGEIAMRARESAQRIWERLG